MAGDWIKMRTDLYRDPKVCVIADLLLNDGSSLATHVNQLMQRDMTVTRNVMRNVTVGALVSVWGVLRHRGKRVDDDLVVRGCMLSVIDDVADVPGFGDAMASVGWAVESDDGVVFPRFFEEFNVDPSDEIKAKNAERQRRHREKLKASLEPESNVTVTSQSNAREEKRREEKKEESTTLSGKPDVTRLNGHKPQALEILDFLNAKTGRRYRPVVANLDMICARLREGATVAECRQVVAKKCREWGSDPKMEQYLRPATLFNRSKFAQYQGELGATDGD